MSTNIQPVLTPRSNSNRQSLGILGLSAVILLGLGPQATHPAPTAFGPEFFQPFQDVIGGVVQAVTHGVHRHIEVRHSLQNQTVCSEERSSLQTGTDCMEQSTSKNEIVLTEEPPSLQTVRTTGGPTYQNDRLTNFDNYILEFNKNYANNQEKDKKREIFQNNLAGILAHNELYKNRKTTYFLRVNDFTDITDEEFDQNYG